MTFALLFTFAVAFLVSMAGTALMRRLGPRWGWLDHPSEHKIHATPTPWGGGVAIFAALWLTVGAAVLLVGLLRSGVLVLPAALVGRLAEHQGGILARAGTLAWVFGGALVVAGVGLIDDKRGLSPWPRLGVQAGVALCLVLFDGQVITLFITNPIICGVISVLWIVGITNTFNLLDNMDGLSAGVGLIVSVFFMVVALQTQQTFVAALCAVMVGALGGFLIFNFPPASIFMGDCGSTLVGYMLAVISIKATFYTEGRLFFPVVVPLLILSVPLFDTLSVVVIRLEQGRSPFAGDHNHFSHRLVALGMSRRLAVLTIYLVAAAIGLGATILYHSASDTATLIVLIQAAVVFMVIVLLERAGRRKA